MTEPQIIDNASGIDLTRHGVIEAHAGTGKTHTIIQMVLRALEQTVMLDKGALRYIHIREIVLVTFTEKAAGELKKRIRDGIETRIQERALADAGRKDELREHLENCCNNLHEALIGTIHAVCLRLLQTWPFETGVHFATEIVDDEEGLKTALRESMRTDWQDQATRIPWGLDQLASEGRGLEQKHFGLVCETAGELLDNRHARLDRPAGVGASMAQVQQTCEELAATLSTLEKDFSGKLDDLIQSLTQARDRGGLEPKRLELLERRLLCLQQMQTGNTYDLKILQNPCKEGAFQIYTKPDLKKNPGLAEVADCALAVSQHALVTTLKAKEELHAQILSMLICETAQLLALRWNRFKLANGLVSYQDMLRLMHAAVHAKGTQFLASLRSRLRFGIIDEFQDTSLLQWEIFKKIFLDDAAQGGPRLFIVGDPKQSIYSFQGADVFSYLQARSALVKNDGRVYYLDKNYRSLPQLVRACNRIFSPLKNTTAAGRDWFAFTGSDGRGIAYPAPGEAGKCAQTPSRPQGPAHPLRVAPLQVMALAGSAPARIQTMTRLTSQTICALKGTTISVPDGLGFEDLVLDYQDFAVIVESHKLAEPFLEQLRADNIPAVKYKMQGVFQSPMARDLHALLRALVLRESDPGPRLALLLTHFFNYPVQQIDPEKDLEPCGDSACCGESACVAHALQEWGWLADKLLWPQLFNSIQQRSGVRERLIRLVDGERHLADLRQVIDYCLEKLFRNNYSLAQLVEHLGLLYSEKERTGLDQNLHVLASEKSSVKVLTMHAAKGLEFPVVFVVTGGSKDAPPGITTLTWTDENYERHVMPVFSTSRGDQEALPALQQACSTVTLQRMQERRRLLYVALTRAQALLFVPMHLDKMIIGEDGCPLWDQCPAPSRSPDNDLTEKLRDLFSNPENLGGCISLFRECDWRPPGEHARPEATERCTPDIAAIPVVNLLPLICCETSYSQLSRRASSDRLLDRSEEENDPAAEKLTEATQPRSVLPGGKETGDALHLAIEELLRDPHMVETLRDENRAQVLVKNYLNRNGILKLIIDPAEQAQAIGFAFDCIRAALTTPLDLPGGGSVTMAHLPCSDRVPEMEFLLKASAHWVHGYMDCVFRIKNETAVHPWRYFVLDWKSDQLEHFNGQTISACIQERHYDLQAGIYSHALDQYLLTILGDTYDPQQNLGGALYVFLRSFKALPQPQLRHTWSRQADPKQDSDYTNDLVDKFVNRHGAGAQ